MTESDIRITSTTFGAPQAAAPTAGAPIGAGLGAGPGAGLGETLRAAREAHRLTLDVTGAALKIKPAYLAALEAERFDLLPTATHAKGFLRSYAHYLGLDAQIDTLLALYQRAVTPVDDALSLSMPQPLPEGKLPTMRVIGGALLAGTLLCIGWYGFRASPPPSTIAPPADMMAPAAPKPPEVAPPVVPTIAPPAAALPETSAPVDNNTVTVPPVAPAVAAPIAAPAPVTQPVATIAAPPVPAAAPVAVAAPVKPPVATQVEPTNDATADGLLRIRAISDSWVEIQDRTGATIFSRLMRAGQEYQVVPEPGLRLTTGNGAGVVIVRDGKAGAPLGARAEVVRNISLSSVKAAAQPTVRVPKPPVAAPHSARPAINWNPPAPEDAVRSDETD